MQDDTSASVIRRRIESKPPLGGHTELSTMSSRAVENRPKTSQIMSCKPSQDDACGHMGIVSKMVVTISNDWIDTLKSLGDTDCEQVLNKIVSQAKRPNGHNIRVVRSARTWSLDGCFCGIKELRTALQDVIQEKQAEKNMEKPTSDVVSAKFENDQQSHLENEKMETEEMRHTNPLAQVENSSLRKMHEEENEANNRSRDQTDNNEKSKFQQSSESSTSTLKTGEEDGNPENFNSGEKNKKRERKLINQEPKVVIDADKNKGRDDLEKEGTAKKTKHSENLNHQVSYPDLHTSKNTEHLENVKPEVKYPDLFALQNAEHPENTKQHLGYQDLPPPKNTEHLGNLKHEVKYSDLPPSKSADHAENLRHQALSPEEATSENTQHSQNVKHSAQHGHFSDFSGRQENPTDDTEHDRICALKLLPSIDIDEGIFYYLFRHQNHELSRISKKCNVFEPYKVKQRHKLAVEVRPGHEMKSVLAEFRKLYEHATVHDIRLPDGVDSESLRNVVESMDDFKDVELRFMSKEKVCKIVGASKDITLAKQKLLEVITSNTNHGYDDPFNGKSQLTVQLTQTSNGKEPTRSVAWHPSTANQVHQAGRSAFKILNQSYDSLLLAVSNCLTIVVKRYDLTKLRNVDVVVSCINHQLETDGLLADQIIRAAGTKVETELVNRKSQIPFLHTGWLVHTSGGNLGGVKALVHVVRPKIFEFPPNEQRSRDVLRTVFINCFCYTNDELRLNSICLPPVGFELYGAEMVVSCFLDAAEMFASTVNNPSAAYHQHPHHLNCIQLVSNDFFCFEELIKCIKRRL